MSDREKENLELKKSIMLKGKENPDALAVICRLITDNPLVNSFNL